MLRTASMLITLGMISACGTNEANSLDAPVFSPSEASAHRLTQAGYRSAVRELFDLEVTSPLPVDLRLNGFTSVGAAQLSIASADLDLYEVAAWDTAALAIPGPAVRDDRLGCALDRVEPAENCIAPWAAALARRAWRRPLDRQDLDLLLDVYYAASEVTQDRTVGTRAVVAAVLQSPWFLFRVEVGDPNGPRDKRRLTDHELAARLASFLTGGLPDEALRSDADLGILSDPEVLEGHVERLLTSEKAPEAVGHFFHEWLELERMDTVEKDGERFPNFSASIKDGMRAELEAMFTDIVFTEDADFRTILTTEKAWLTPALAEHYGLPSMSEPAWVLLPEEQDRGGILGRAGFLTLESHRADTSPTHRGLFIQSRLLCNSIPPPPAGIETTLPAVDPENPITTRERLAQHAQDPACSSCHQLVDPMGLTLEHYDAVGAYRETEHGLPIDASGDVMGVPVEGAAELGQAIAEDPQLVDCIVRQVYRHALGTSETEEAEPAIAELVASAEAENVRLSSLIGALVRHESFQTVEAASIGSCAAEGAKRTCETECGEGTSECRGGKWQACSAPPASPEVCNGIDDDCDGIVDEAIRVCEGAFVDGVESCEDGEWTGVCVGSPAMPETCNGVDDDRDGEIDEGLDIDRAWFAPSEVEGEQPSCRIGTDPMSGACRAAVNRVCNLRDCSVTGFGPIGSAAATVDAICLDESMVQRHWVSYADLAAQHQWCNTGNPVGSDCNASIRRWCKNVKRQSSGFGPLEYSTTGAFVACTPEATEFSTQYSLIASFSPGGAGACNGVNERLGAACNFAIDGWCRDQGFRTGYGPVENYGDNLIVACLP